jgi:hypothetical protein
MIGKIIDSNINQNPWITLASTLEIIINLVSHPFPETTLKQ